MSARARPLAVFVGPSLEPSRVAAALPGVRVEPPARRGDVDRLLGEGVGTFLLIDGAFAHTLAVSPGELVRALANGARVIGAASLGAVRAAECRPAGMEGVGAVQLLYRLRVIADDDEVAVAVEPDRDHRATSVALINVRFAVLAALQRRLLNRARARALLAAAKATHFSQRHWHLIFAAAGVELTASLHALCQASDVKRRDAELAVARLAGEAVSSRAPTVARTAPPPRRYRGHDPLLGLSAAGAGRELGRWLLATGRYRRYRDVPPPGQAPDELWAELARRPELALELMRCYAVRRGAGLASSADGAPLGPYLEPARRDLADNHGYPSWGLLEASAAIGRLPDGVPVAWVRAAAHAIALARRNLAAPRT